MSKARAASLAGPRRFLMSFGEAWQAAYLSCSSPPGTCTSRVIGRPALAYYAHEQGFARLGVLLDQTAESEASVTFSLATSRITSPTSMPANSPALFGSTSATTTPFVPESRAQALGHLRGKGAHTQTEHLRPKNGLLHAAGIFRELHIDSDGLFHRARVPASPSLRAQNGLSCTVDPWNP